MKLKKSLLTAAVSTFGFVLTATADDPFIELGPNVKVVFTQVVIDGNTVTQAAATVTEVVGNVTTVKRQIEVTVPTGNPASPFEKQVTQETTVATLSGGVYTVETTTDLFTTPLDVNQDPTGPVVDSVPCVLVPFLTFCRHCYTKYCILYIEHLQMVSSTIIHAIDHKTYRLNGRVV